MTSALWILAGSGPNKGCSHICMDLWSQLSSVQKLRVIGVILTKSFFWDSIKRRNLQQWSRCSYTREQSKCFSRLAYLLFSNKRNSKIMIQISNTLIRILWHCKMDLPNNMLWSSFILHRSRIPISTSTATANTVGQENNSRLYWRIFSLCRLFPRIHETSPGIHVLDPSMHFLHESNNSNDQRT